MSKSTTPKYKVSVVSQTDNQTLYEKELTEKHRYLHIYTEQGRHYIVSKNGLQEAIPYYKHGIPTDQTDLSKKVRNREIPIVWEIKPASFIVGTICKMYFTTEEEFQNQEIKNPAENLTRVMGGESEQETEKYSIKIQAIEPAPVPAFTTTLHSQATQKFSGGIASSTSRLSTATTPRTETHRQSPPPIKTARKRLFNEGLDAAEENTTPDIPTEPIGKWTRLVHERVDSEVGFFS